MGERRELLDQALRELGVVILAQPHPAPAQARRFHQGRQGDPPAVDLDLALEREPVALLLHREAQPVELRFAGEARPGHLPLHLQAARSSQREPAQRLDRALARLDLPAVRLDRCRWVEAQAARHRARLRQLALEIAAGEGPLVALERHRHRHAVAGREQRPRGKRFDPQRERKPGAGGLDPHHRPVLGGPLLTSQLLGQLDGGDGLQPGEDARQRRQRLAGKIGAVYLEGLGEPQHRLRDLHQ